MSSFEEYFYINLGKKIRSYRQKHGLTQEALAEVLKLNPKYIGHIERFERKISLSVCLKLMQYFKIQPHEFFKFKQ